MHPGYNWCYIKSGSRCKQLIPTLLIAGGTDDHRKKFCATKPPLELSNTQWTGDYDTGRLTLHVDRALDGVLHGHINLQSIYNETASYQVGGAWSVTGSNPGYSRRWSMELSPTSPITRSDIDGYTKIGTGYCNKGYNTGDHSPGITLATCQSQCSADASCYFVSFVEGKSCARYNAPSWQYCVGQGLYTNSAQARTYTTYMKNSGQDVVVMG